MTEQKLVVWGWSPKGYSADIYKTYLLNRQNYLKIWDRQNGKCAGCRGEFAHPVEKIIDRFGLKPEVDHCHKNGHVRGLLCRRCNGFLGKIQDNKDILAGLLAYLKERGEPLL